MEIRESTATVVKLGPFTALDGFTPYTTVGSMAVKVTKNGGTLAARSSATAITHDSDGYFNVAIDSTDTNTRGRLELTVTNAAAHPPVFKAFDVVAGPWYDEKYGAAIALQGAASGSATLDAGASGVVDYYRDQFITIVGGTGAGQTRRITAYNQTTKVATVDRSWGTTPVAGSTYRLISNASASLSVAERDAIVAALFATATESGRTFQEAMIIQTAAASGPLTGATAGSGTVLIKNAAGTKTRISANYDAFGNRLSVSFPDLTP
jgi:hypothetical protein